MEQSVPERVDLQSVDRVGRVVGDADAVVVGARQHVMPLQYLMEQDAVDESTETDAEDDSRQSERGCRVFTLHW